MKSSGVKQDFGAITKIEVPDPNNYGKFKTVGTSKGAKGEATATLTNRYFRNVKSDLLRLARIGCALDAQIHFGGCGKPSDFNTYDKIVVAEDLQITNWGTGDLGALTQGEDVVVDETGDISAQECYEILPLAYATAADDLVTNEVIDVVIADEISCSADCGTKSDGKQKIYAVTAKAGGSSGTPPDLVYSLNGGATWYAHDIDSLSSAQDPSGLAEVGNYMVVTSYDATNLSYVLKASILGGVDHTWTAVSTGFVAAKGPKAIWSTGARAFIVGAGGYIYYTDDPTGGVTVMDSGSAAAGDNLVAVHGLDSTFVVAVGDAGAIVYTADGVLWTAVPRFVPVWYGFNGVWVKSKTEWWVVTNNGHMYSTINGGTTWAEKTFSGSGSGICGKIKFSTPTVAYMTHTTAANVGRVFKSVDGGYTWKVQPDPNNGTMPTLYKAKPLAVTPVECNFVVIGGLYTASDGRIVIGSR
jgi:hypothetical protein